MCYKWTQMVQLVKSYKKHLKIGSIQIFWIEGACITFNRLFSTTFAQGKLTDEYSHS